MKPQKFPRNHCGFFFKSQKFPRNYCGFFLKNAIQQELGVALNKDAEEYDQVLKLSNYIFEVKATEIYTSFWIMATSFQ